jgi:hypothetical protein
MKRFLILSIVFVLLSCKANEISLESRTLSRLLGNEERVRLKNDGEIYVSIQSQTATDTVKGVYRILRIGQSDSYRIVEVGSWYRRLDYFSNGIRKGSQRDYIVYDSLGNLVSKDSFDKPKGADSYYLINRFTSSKSDDLFLQHVSVYRKDSTIASEFTLRVINFSEVKGDNLKKKIRYGTQRDFNSKGELVTETKYDENGKMLGSGK